MLCDYTTGNRFSRQDVMCMQEFTCHPADQLVGGNWPNSRNRTSNL